VNVVGGTGSDFDEFVVARGTALLGFAFVLCGNRELAEDLVQSVLVRVHGRWQRVTAADRPDAYVRRMLVHEYLGWRRRRSSSELPSAHTPDVGQADHAVGLADRDAVWRLLATLPRQQRAVLVLRYYEDLSDAQISEVLGCSTATVRTHASKAHAALRAHPALAAAAREEN
jgi:RNA polymerase sigma-70 factor (sigma-E family)